MKTENQDFNNVQLFGFLNIYKPKGLTSHDVVSRLRKVTKIKQIGHTGTLDPFAVGVLPVAIGKATRLIEYLDDDKAYLAQVQFGKNTNTYDIDGEIVEEFNKQVEKDEILEALKSFEGEITQFPPIYSAIKVKGKKLYEYARAGEDVEVKSRTVNISKIELIDFDKEKQSAKIYVACSKGTYIRSIAYDLGKMLNCGGYLTELERVQAGKFLVEKSVKLENISEILEVYKFLISPETVINKPTYELSDTEKTRVSHGMSIDNHDFLDSDIVILLYSGKIYAIGVVEQDKILVKKVFEVL